MSLKKTFYKIISFLLHKKDIYYFKVEENKLLKQRNSRPLESSIKKKIKKKYKKYGFNNLSTKSHRYLNSFFNDLDSKIVVDFIPNQIFYTKIESSLNNAVMFPALEDKNLLDVLFPKSFLPDTVIKNQNGVFYGSESQITTEIAIEKCSKETEIVIKPSIGTYGGKGVRKIIFNNESDKKSILRKLFKEYNSNFIVQKVILQHKQLSKLNPSSINTVRIITYMRSEEVIPLSSVIRIGRYGSFIDNSTSGGIVCGIDANGCLKEQAYDRKDNIYYTTDSGIELKGFKIPHFTEMKNLAKIAHKSLPYFKLVSWDITINENLEIKLIEYNAFGQEIYFHQKTNGPLFGELTSEILEITKKHNPIDYFMKYGI